jgi:hypothetical protein
VSRGQPGPGCTDVLFDRRYPLAPAAELALEDYARVLACAAAAEAVPDPKDPARLCGVHLCQAPEPPAPGVREDIEAFARELAEPRDSGLGWS